MFRPRKPYAKPKEKAAFYLLFFILSASGLQWEWEGGIGRGMGLKDETKKQGVSLELIAL